MKKKNVDVYHEFLTTPCNELSDWDLDALLQGLNYIGFALGLGCFFVIKDEIQYRSFNGEVPLLMCNGKQGLNFLIKNSNIEFVTKLWIDARLGKSCGRLSSNELKRYVSV